MPQNLWEWTLGLGPLQRLQGKYYKLSHFVYCSSDIPDGTLAVSKNAILWLIRPAFHLILTSCELKNLWTDRAGGSYWVQSIKSQLSPSTTSLIRQQKQWYLNSNPAFGGGGGGEPYPNRFNIKSLKLFCFWWFKMRQDQRKRQKYAKVYIVYKKDKKLKSASHPSAHWHTSSSLCG